MGIPAYLVASSVIGIVAQRLVRKICPECKRKQTIPAQEAGFFPKRKEYNLYRGNKCESCNKTGYKGRTALHEILLIDDVIKQMIIDNRGNKDIFKYARTKGMIALKQDGINKALQGLTSYEELVRVLK
jgi:type IV pilus assembly protein PilB